MVRLTVKSMPDNLKSYNDILAEVKANYEFHREEATRFKRLLDAVIDFAPEPIAPTVNINHKTVIQKQIPQAKVKANPERTFEDIIIEILNDGMPRTGRDLSLEYLKRTGLEYSRKDFASRLAMVKKSKGTFKNIEYREFPTENRFWWGLTDWYEGNDLKKEFKDKIYRSMGISIQHSLMH